MPIPSWLHEDVQDVTGLIHGAPQVLLATLDRDEHLGAENTVQRRIGIEPCLPSPPISTTLRASPNSHDAQPAERSSACSSTVRVADSCLSGG